jgi:3-isopropylmalate/(R)-2-methylmalate dehydratase small subunit
MQPFEKISGVAVPMIEDDVNTDQIAPLQLAKGLSPDWGDLLFKRQRFAPDGSVSDHVLNRPQYRAPAILVANENFGCGSSRESAVWCLTAIGIRCIVARSIADIFRENCLQNGVLPVELTGADMDRMQSAVLATDGAQSFSVNLPEQIIVSPDGATFQFDVSASDKVRLIEGLDEIGMTMKHLIEIEAWEARIGASHSWLQQAEDRKA